MQEEEKKQYFIEKTSELIKELRLQKQKSISKIASEYEIDKSNWSKIERGFYSIEFATAWKIVELIL